MTDIIEEANNAVDAVTDRKTFSIIDTIRNRAYPKATVEVFLDENAAYESSVIAEMLEQSKLDDGNGQVSERTLKLESELADKLNDIESSKLIFELKGISEGDREKIFEEVIEQFPLEYEEVKNPLSGAITKKEIENKSRDRFYTFKLWQAHLNSVKSSDGAEQTDFTVDDIAEIRSILPIAATAAIAETIEKLRVSTAVFMSKVNEDFLAKR